MEVLLVSPKDPQKPSQLKFLMGGENTFTKVLLENPPQGVTYTYFTDALEKGEIVYTFWQHILSFLIKFRILPLDVGFQCVQLKKKFAVIHAHGYGLKIDGQIQPPVILSDSSSNFFFLRDYLGWSLPKIKLLHIIRRFVSCALHLYDQNLHLQSATLVVWSEFAKKMHVELGGDPRKIQVIPPGIQKNQRKISQAKNTFTILFVGTWFERKGGMLLLKAFKIVKKKYPSITLEIIGQVPKRIQLSKDIVQKEYVSRDELLKKIFPKADVLVHVPPLAEGFGVVVLEAFSFGIPVIVSSVYALPEIVKDGETGFVVRPGSVEDIVKALVALIKNKKLREKMGRSAKKRFIKKYWIIETNKMLLKTYKRALRKQSTLR